jgi:L-ascorbate metabolism protein UlaG (beta-lactamase superfamily)
MPEPVDHASSIQGTGAAAGGADVRAHYLGHASFVLCFGSTTVLVDHGEPNAWVESGWDSPIRDVGDLVPDLATYSHTYHADHFAASRLPAGTPVVSSDGRRVRVRDVTAEGIPVCERDPMEADGYAYLFAYRGVRVLHLGDCQANLAALADPTHRRRFLRRLPRRCDLLLLPIESTRQVSSQAVELLRLLRPRFTVPMHFWSEETRGEFLDLARASGGPVRVCETPGSELAVSRGSVARSSFVVPLRRAPFRGWCEDETSSAASPR